MTARRTPKILNQEESRIHGLNLGLKELCKGLKYLLDEKCVQEYCDFLNNEPENFQIVVSTHKGGLFNQRYKTVAELKEELRGYQLLLDKLVAGIHPTELTPPDSAA